MLSSKTVTSTVKRGQTGSPVGGGGPPADDDRGCYDPVWPCLTLFDPVLLLMLPFLKLNSMLLSLWFRFNQPPHFSMITFFDVTPLYRKNNGKRPTPAHQILEENKKENHFFI